MTANLEAYYATLLEKELSLRDLKTLLYQPYGENLLPICHVLLLSNNNRLIGWLYEQLKAAFNGTNSETARAFPLRSLIQLARNEEECNDRFHSSVTTFDFVFVDRDMPIDLGSIEDFMESVRENFGPEETVCVGVCQDNGSESGNVDAMAAASSLLGVEYVTVEYSGTVGTLWRELCRKHYGPVLASMDAVGAADLGGISLKAVRLPKKTIYRKKRSNNRPVRVPYHSIMASLPHTLHEALQLSSEARAITEVEYPFDIIYVNDAWAAQWGSEADYIKDHPGNLVKLHVRDVAADEDSYRDSMSSLALELIGGLPYSSFLVSSKGLSGEEVISHYRVLPLHAPSGAVLHFLVILEFVH
jgi:hypothetical protein